MAAFVESFRFSPLWVLVLMLGVAPVASAEDFYVRSAGDDSRDGRAKASAWRTLARAEQEGFLPGDTLNLEGGSTFAGRLRITSWGLTIQSYDGRAIVASTTDGITLYNTGNITIRNLELVGERGLYTSGIQVYIDEPNLRIPAVTLEDIDVHDFAVGIHVWGNAPDAGVDGLRISRIAAHHNRNAGVVTQATSRLAHRDVIVSDSWAGWNVGAPDYPDSSGNGIALGQVDGGVIQRSVALENGAGCTGGACGAGLWAWDSNDVWIRWSESHHNRTGGLVDGDGFDLDWGTTNSGVEDSYSHDNEGAGYLAVQLEGVAAKSGNNVFRRNRSVNDGLKNNFAALMIYGDVGTVTFEGNTVSGSWAVREDSLNNAGFRFTCNTYAGPFRAWWDGSVYEDVGSFGAATGQASCAQPASAAPALAGTRTPADPFVTASDGAIWTLDNSMVLRNGEHQGEGWGSQILLAQGLIYVFGTDNQWWRDAGTGWTPIGTTEPPQ